MKAQKISFIIHNCSVEPLGIMYLSSILKKAGHAVDLYKYDSKKELYDYLDGFRPDIVALSITTGQHVKLLEIARLVKKHDKNITIIAGGPHITYFPEVAKEDYIDYIIKGEADHAFPKLVDNISAGKLPKNNQGNSQKNTQKNSKKNSQKNKDQSILSLPSDLDSIPFPDRGIAYKYREFGGNPVRNVMTSRGCPYNCSYCYNSVYRNLYKNQNIVRFRSPKNIIDECRELVRKYHTKMIFFADDEFSMNIKRLKKMKDLYIREIKLPFHCQIRIDFLDEERIKILKEMGCYSLTFAIESGNEGIRKRILNRNITNKQIIDGCRLLKKYGIRFRAENMIGLPDETFRNVLETLDLNIKVRPDYSWVSLYQPYPKTPLGEYCRAKRLFNGNNDLIKENFTEDTVLKMPEECRNRLLNLQRLFGIIVAFPILRNLLPVLLKPKGKKFYTSLRQAWKRHCYQKRLFAGTAGAAKAAKTAKSAGAAKAAAGK